MTTEKKASNIDHYNSLLERARNIRVQHLTPINQCIQYASDMFTKAKELEPNSTEEKFVLYYRIVIYIDEKLPSHPLWSSVRREEKARLNQISNKAFNKAMSLKSEIRNLNKAEAKKKRNSKNTKEMSIETEFKYFSESCRESDISARSELMPTTTQDNIDQVSSHLCRPTIDECSTGDAAGEETMSGSGTCRLQSRPPFIATVSYPGTKKPTKSTDSPLKRSVSEQPSRLKDGDLPVQFCSECKKKANNVAIISCVCLLKSNTDVQEKHTQTNESYINVNYHNKYDAFLLATGKGAALGDSLRLMLTSNGYRICTLKQKNNLGENIVASYAKLISTSNYVIAIVSEELLEGSLPRWLLDRSFWDVLWRNYNFLLPVVMKNCELPPEMQNIVSYKISDNENPDIQTLFDQLVECLKSKNVIF